MPSAKSGAVTTTIPFGNCDMEVLSCSIGTASLTRVNYVDNVV